MKMKRYLVNAFLVVCVALTSTQCTNYGLYEKFADPESTLPEKLVAFVLSGSTNGAMDSYNAGLYVSCSSYSSIFRADCACQVAATNAGLPMPKSGKYVAWMSLAAPPLPWDMTCRIQGEMGTACAAPKKDASWKTTVGNTIASSRGRLFSGSLEAPLNRDQITGIVSNMKVWTGTNPDGTVAGSAGAATCDDWTNGSSYTATIGDPASNDSNWTQYSTSATCDGGGMTSIYCFGQMAP